MPKGFCRVCSQDVETFKGQPAVFCERHMGHMAYSDPRCYYCLARVDLQANCGDRSGGCPDCRSRRLRGEILPFMDHLRAPGRHKRRAEEAMAKSRPKVTVEMTLHPSVVRMAKAMQEKLDRDAHKGPWEAHEPRKFLASLVQELAELIDAKSGNEHGEAADVANYAMFYADATERLRREFAAEKA